MQEALEHMKISVDLPFITIIAVGGSRAVFRRILGDNVAD